MKKTSGKLQIRNSTAEFLIFTRQAGEGGPIRCDRSNHQRASCQPLTAR